MIIAVGNPLLARRLGGYTRVVGPPLAASGIFDATICFNNGKTCRATFPSCPEARRLHPVGALARPHSVGGHRVRAQQGPARISRWTPGPRPAPSTSPSASSSTARPSAQLFQVARRLGPHVRARRPRRHRRLHHQQQRPSAQLFQVARRLHLVGALARPHSKHAAPVACPPPTATGIFDAIYYIDTR